MCVEEQRQSVIEPFWLIDCHSIVLAEPSRLPPDQSGCITAEDYEQLTGEDEMNFLGSGSTARDCRRHWRPVDRARNRHQGRPRGLRRCSWGPDDFDGAFENKDGSTRTR